MTKIKEVIAREVLDSRGLPTVEVDILVGNFVATSSVSHDAFSIKHEATTLKDRKKRYHGHGVQTIINKINREVRRHLIKKDVRNQHEIDQLLLHIDGTPNKSDIGANGLIALSMAVCRAGAYFNKLSLFNYVKQIYGIRKVRFPKLVFTMISGGKHTQNGFPFQECMIIPRMRSLHDKVRAASEIFHTLHMITNERYNDPLVSNIHDGHAFSLNTVEEALNLLMVAIKRSGYKNKVDIGLNAAATTLYDKGTYQVHTDSVWTSQELFSYYKKLSRLYPLTFLEDPFHYQDITSFKEITKKMGRKMKIVAGDLTVTNPRFIRLAARNRASDSVCIKPSQIGTITETLTASKIAHKNGWDVVVSKRFRETPDDFIADLACGIGAEYFKGGAPIGDGAAKYNRLLRIVERV